MKYFVVLDTNILVSSLISNDKQSTINQLINFVFENKIIPIFTDDIYDEYLEVLNRKEFNILPYKIGGLLNLIKNKGIMIKAKEFEKVVVDHKDQIFYDAYMSKRDDNAYLVTGNLKHFPISEYIVNAKQMLEIILNNKRYA